MGIYDSGDVVFLGNAADQFVDENGCFWVEAGVWLIAEKIDWVEYNRAGNANANPIGGWRRIKEYT